MYMYIYILYILHVYNIVPISFLILVVYLILTSILPPLTLVIKVIRVSGSAEWSTVSKKRVLTLEAKQK